MALLEAMSYGSCCLVSDIPENLAVTGDFGASFRHGSVEDLRRELEALLADPSRREYYRSHAAEHVLSNFNWDAVTRQTLQLYQK